MKLLAIETSSSVCGAAFYRDGELCDLKEVNESRVHARKLPVFVDQILKNNQLDVADLDGIAVSEGPGSYTGLRIGMSLAKGLAFTHQIPLVPVPTLQAMACRIDLTETCWVVLYSHRNLVYAQLFNNRIPQNEPECLAFDRLSQYPIFGFGMKEDQLHLTEIRPSAVHVGILGFQNFDKWSRKDAGNIYPNYITEFNIGKSPA